MTDSNPCIVCKFVTLQSCIDCAAAVCSRCQAEHYRDHKHATPVLDRTNQPRGEWHVEPTLRFDGEGRRVERWKAWTPSREVVVETRAEAEAMVERWNGAPAASPAPDMPQGFDLTNDAGTGDFFVVAKLGMFERRDAAVTAARVFVDSLTAPAREQAAAAEREVERWKAAHDAVSQQADAIQASDDESAAIVAKQIEIVDAMGFEIAHWRSEVARLSAERAAVRAEGVGQGRREGLHEAADEIRIMAEGPDVDDADTVITLRQIADDMDARADATASPKAAPEPAPGWCPWCRRPVPDPRAEHHNPHADAPSALRWLSTRGGPSHG